MRLFGLIGYPLDHSFSEKYFAEKFRLEGTVDAVYRNFPLENISGLPDLLRENPLDGFNVTIPYKESIIPYLTRLSPPADEIGAVNCVVRTGPELVGYNTDFYGFRESLLQLIGDDRPPALVLGSGGASRAVTFVLRELGIEHIVVSTHPGKNPAYLRYCDLDERLMKQHRLIVNTTPLGTFPDIGTAPAIPYKWLTPEHYLFDLVYNPPMTAFLAYGQESGAAVMNGYRMLELQADKAWEIFNR